MLRGPVGIEVFAWAAGDFGPMDEDERNDLLAAYSKRLYGRAHALLIHEAVATAVSGEINATDLHWQLRLPQNTVNKELGLLEHLGLLERAPVKVDGKVIRRRVDDDEFWSLVRRHCLAARNGRSAGTRASR